MLFAFFLCFLAYGDICLVGKTENKVLCPELYSTILTFDEISDDILKQENIFVLYGEKTTENQVAKGDSQLPAIISILQRTISLAGNSNVPRQTFKSSDERQQILIDELVDSRSIASFYNIDFVETATTEKSFSFSEIFLYNCTHHGTSTGKTNIVVENCLQTDIISMIGWYMIQTSPTVTTQVILLEYDDFIPTDTIKYENSININYKVALVINNINIYKQCTIYEGSSSYDFEFETVTGMLLAIENFRLLEANSIEINCGDVIHDEPVILSFSSGRAVQEKPYPNVNIKTTADTSLTIEGSFKSWSDYSENGDQFTKTIFEISHNIVLNLNLESFPYIIKQKEGNVTFNILQSCVLNAPFYVQTTNPSYLIFSSTAYLSLTFDSGIIFETTNTQFDFTDPSTFVLVSKTFDFSKVGAFSVYPLIFRMYKDNQGKITFPLITLKEQEIPVMSADKYVIIDPCIPLLPTLTQAEVEALVPNEAKLFFTVATNSGFPNAQVVFPFEQGQHGFWKESSILVYQSSQSESYYMKATIDAEKRKSLALNVYLSKEKQNEGYTMESLDAESLTALIPDVVTDINVYVKGDIETFIDFSQLTEEQQNKCVFNIVGEKTNGQKLTLIDTEKAFKMNVENIVLDTNSDNFVIGSKTALLQDCLFTEKAAQTLTFKENCDISVLMTWNDFKDFNKKKQSDINFQNAKLTITDIDDITEIDFYQTKSVMKAKSGDEISYLLNDENNLPILKLNDGIELKINGMIENKQKSIDRTCLVIETSGKVIIGGNWTDNGIVKEIQFNNNNKDLIIEFESNSIPFFEIQNEDKCKYYISDSFATLYFSTAEIIQFPEWFNNKQIHTNINTIKDNYGIELSPSTNVLVFNSITAESISIAYLNNKVVVNDGITLNPGSSLLFNESLQYTKTISLKWDLIDGFSNIKLPSSYNPKAINIVYDSENTNIEQFNKIFSSPIENTEINGSFIFSNLQNISLNIFTLSGIPTEFEEADIHLINVDNNIFITANQIFKPIEIIETSESSEIVETTELSEAVETSDSDDNLESKKTNNSALPIWGIALLVLLFLILITISILITYASTRKKETICNDDQQEPNSVAAAVKNNVDPENLKPTKRKKKVKRAVNDENSGYSYTYSYSTYSATHSPITLSSDIATSDLLSSEIDTTAETTSNDEDLSSDDEDSDETNSNTSNTNNTLTNSSTNESIEPEFTSSNSSNSSTPQKKKNMEDSIEFATESSDISPEKLIKNTPRSAMRRRTPGPSITRTGIHSEVRRRSLKANQFPQDLIRTPKPQIRRNLDSDEDEKISSKITEPTTPKFTTPRSIRNRTPIIVSDVKTPVSRNNENNRYASNNAVTPRRENVNNDNTVIEMPKLMIREPTSQTPNRPILSNRKIAFDNQHVSKTPRSSRRRRRAIDLSKDDIPIFARFSKTQITPRRKSLKDLSSDISDSDDDTLVIPSSRL